MLSEHASVRQIDVKSVGYKPSRSAPFCVMMVMVIAIRRMVVVIVVMMMATKRRQSKETVLQ